VLSYYVYLHSEFHVVMSITTSAKTDVRFVFPSRCFKEGSCNLYVICVCLRIAVRTTYGVVFWFVCLYFVYPMLASFPGLSIFDCPSVFSKVYYSYHDVNISWPTSDEYKLSERDQTWASNDECWFIKHVVEI
jgi:hypothetical protein